jgi:hypothetical protein
MRTSAKRTFAAAAASTLALCIAACGGSSDDPSTVPSVSSPATTRTTPAATGGVTAPKGMEAVTGGRTVLVLDETVSTVLNAVGIEVAPVRPARDGAGGIVLPVTGGTIDPAQLGGSVEHQGGLRLTAGNQAIEVTDLMLGLSDGRLTGQIQGTTVPIADIRSADALVASSDGAVTVDGLAATLSTQMLDAVSGQLGVRLPAGRLRFGRLDVRAETAH